MKKLELDDNGQIHGGLTGNTSEWIGGIIFWFIIFIIAFLLGSCAAPSHKRTCVDPEEFRRELRRTLYQNRLEFEFLLDYVMREDVQCEFKERIKWLMKSYDDVEEMRRITEEAIREINHRKDK